MFFWAVYPWIHRFVHNLKTIREQVSTEEKEMEERGRRYGGGGDREGMRRECMWFVISLIFFYFESL